MQCVLHDKLSVTSVFLVVPSVSPYCFFFFSIKIVRHLGKDMSSGSLFFFGFCMMLFYCSSGPGNKCRYLCVCALASIRGIDRATWKAGVRTIGGEFFTSGLLARNYLLTIAVLKSELMGKFEESTHYPCKSSHAWLLLNLNNSLPSA